MRLNNDITDDFLDAEYQFNEYLENSESGQATDVVYVNAVENYEGVQWATPDNSFVETQKDYNGYYGEDEE